MYDRNRSDAPRSFELNAEPGSYSIRGAPAALSLGVTVVYAIGTAEGWHLAADHHDLVAYGTELLVVMALIFVGGRLVAGRKLSLSRPTGGRG
jgi:hypothetical protein